MFMLKTDIHHVFKPTKRCHVFTLLPRQSMFLRYRKYRYHVFYVTKEELTCFMLKNKDVSCFYVIGQRNVSVYVETKHISCFYVTKQRISCFMLLKKDRACFYVI